MTSEARSVVVRLSAETLRAMEQSRAEGLPRVRCPYCHMDTQNRKDSDRWDGAS